jgi:anti-anti-sigma factor
MAADRNGGFTAEVAQRDGHVVVIVRGEIDMVTAVQFRGALETAMAAGGRIEVDLRDTTFMDSTGLAVLVSAHRELGPAHEPIVVREPPRLIRTLLDVSGVAALLEIRSDGQPPAHEMGGS